MRRNYSRLWLDFLDAEKEFDQILQYIPFSNENNVTHSPKIASLIVKSCSRNHLLNIQFSHPFLII